MAVESLRCPTCGAADNSRADAAGVHACSYCNVRYRPTAAGGVSLGRFGPVARGRVVAVAVALSAGAGTMGFLVARQSVTVAPVAPAPVASLVEPRLAGSSGPAVAGSSPPAVAGSSPPTVAGSNPAATVVVSQGAPEAEVPAQARFEFHHTRPSAGSSFYAIGWVINDSPFTIDMPKITAVLMDPAGKEVGTAFGFAVDLVGPGERVPASILVSDPPAHAKVNYELVPRKASYVPPVVEGLRLEPGDVVRDEFGFGYRVSGKVHHEGREPAKFVQIRVLAKDAEGKLLGIDESFADAEVLAPGASARFTVRMLRYAAAPVSFDFAVSGRTAG